MRGAADSHTKDAFFWQIVSNPSFERRTTQRIWEQARDSELDALLGADSDIKWVFDFAHLGDEISGFD